jgi:prolyl-tRNA synthetase
MEKATINPFANWGASLYKANFLKFSPKTKGCYIFTERLLNLLKSINKVAEFLVKKDGHEEVYFPLFGDLAQLKIEEAFLDGFTPEVYAIKDETLYLRPTSEAIIYSHYAGNIEIAENLPLKIYQIVNVFRKETKETRPLLRHREIQNFFERHTFHKTKTCRLRQIQKNKKYLLKIFKFLGLEKKVQYTKRAKNDTFPGAIRTYAFDYAHNLYGSLQVRTTHYYGQNFAKPFNIHFFNKDNKLEYVEQTTTGWSERIRAVLLMENYKISLQRFALHTFEKTLVLYYNHMEDKRIKKLIKKEKQYFKKLNLIFYPEKKEQLSLKQIHLLLDTKTSFVLAFKRSKDGFRFWLTDLTNKETSLTTFERLPLLINESLKIINALL